MRARGYLAKLLKEQADDLPVQARDQVRAGHHCGNLGDLPKSISGPPQGNCEESKDGREKRDVGIRLVENIIPKRRKARMMEASGPLKMQ